jgi:glycosyltransferase 2 family protein
VLSVHSQWGTVRHDLADLPVTSAILAFLFSALAVVASMFSWRALLADLGSPLPAPAAIRIFALSQLGKYLPGSVWPMLASMELGRAHRIPRLRSATAFLLTLLMGLVSAVALGGLLAISTSGWGRAYALLPLSLVLVHPRILGPVSRALARALHRPQDIEEPTLAGVAKALCWIVLQWLSLAVAMSVLTSGLGSSVSFDRLLAAVTLSWAAGLVVIVVPAGVGVRESLVTVLLAPETGTARALTAALLARFAITLADGAFAGYALLTRPRRAPSPGEDSSSTDDGDLTHGVASGQPPCSPG